ncbi:putative Co/Zn/Cd efflux system membrane fusion protein [Paramagnetospirillum magnetotacticum MS-1]|uniref:Putative Co/Zn/Cd efflux system membrane fusion protein n=1 Tax=Paramagnetospirillum magnetotacticum MS-1 TaxID=272627 RepID=A0A0C2UA44_PARME|nr:efflux RND transporter periplasmic adaptor subunit [Paramagnetospirillum magnetotacticum]KIL98357.1 putative Co/Zn/Cd efflux system membrane fusion protein [Paramagnetospirillum magnetotacticum MS-1]
MFKLLRRQIPLLLILLALAAGGGWWWWRITAPEVEAVFPKRGTAVEAIYATGTVEAEKWARIAPVSPGRIAEILAFEGDMVKAGQPLARLDDREASARIAELEAKAAYWREEMTRSAALTERGYRSTEATQKARSEFNQVTAAINAARQKRTDLLVTSPMDGMVLKRDGEIGELAEVKDALFWVGAPRPLRITSEVDEEDIARVRIGQKVLIKADAFAERVLEAQVDRITPKGDPVNKTFRVRVVLPDDTPLLVGMTTEINIITALHPDVLLVPVTALKDGKVLAVQDGRVASQAVQTGIRGRTMVEVTEGLGSDTPILASPPAGLKPGDRVRVK